MMALPAIAGTIGKTALKGSIVALAGCITKGVYGHAKRICRTPRKISEMEQEIKYLNETLDIQEKGFLELYERLVRLEKKEAQAE